MRQNWLASWKTSEGEEWEYGFTCLDKEVLAHLGFRLELKHWKVPIPEEYHLERVGDPYCIAERGSSHGRHSCNFRG